MAIALEQYEQVFNQIIHNLSHSYIRIPEPAHWHDDQQELVKVVWHAGGDPLEDRAKLSLSYNAAGDTVAHYRLEGTDEDTTFEVFHPDGSFLDIQLNLTRSKIEIEYSAGQCFIGSRPILCHFNYWLLLHLDIFVGQALSRQPVMQQIFEACQPNAPSPSATQGNWTYQAQLLSLQIPTLEQLRG